VGSASMAGSMLGGSPAWTTLATRSSIVRPEEWNPIELGVRGDFRHWFVQNSRTTLIRSQRS